MKLPTVLRVKLRLSSRMPVLDGILVSLDIRLAGRYYFGTIFGLTDGLGEATITGSRVQADFERNRDLFPMDLKVPLVECDSVVRVKVHGGREFKAAQRMAVDGPLTAPDAREMWTRARNALIEPAQLDVDVSVLGGEIVAELPVRLVSDDVPA